jgi:hypothetical protein
VLWSSCDKKVNHLAAEHGHDPFHEPRMDGLENLEGMSEKGRTDSGILTDGSWGTCGVYDSPG